MYKWALNFLPEHTFVSCQLSFSFSPSLLVVHCTIDKLLNEITNLNKSIYKCTVIKFNAYSINLSSTQLVIHRLPDNGATPDVPLESLALKLNNITSYYNNYYNTMCMHITIFPFSIYPQTSLACRSPGYLGRGNRACMARAKVLSNHLKIFS